MTLGVIEFVVEVIFMCKVSNTYFFGFCDFIGTQNSISLDEQIIVSQY